MTSGDSDVRDKKKEQRRQTKSTIKGRDTIRAPDVLQVPRKRRLTKNT